METPSHSLQPFLAHLASLGVGQAAQDALTAAYVGTRTYPRRATIVEEADGTDPLHLLVKGWAARCHYLEDGSRQITDFVLPGDLCDLSRLGDGSMDTVISLTAVKAALLDRKTVRAAMERYPALAEALMQLAFNEQAILRAWLVCLGQREKREHAAHLLCELQERLHHAGLVTDHEFDMPLTQEELAEAMGVTAVHMNRVLQRLRNDGLISLDRQHLRMLKPEQLKEIGEFDPAYLPA